MLPVDTLAEPQGSSALGSKRMDERTWLRSRSTAVDITWPRAGRGSREVLGSERCSSAANSEKL